MRTARYPLAAARTQRDLARQAATLVLAEARTRLAQAEAAALATRADRAALLTERSATLTAATAAGGHGPRSQKGAAELARHGTYAARLRGELNSLERHIEVAQRAVAERARAVRLAELTLAEAHAQRELVERHHARFREAEGKALEHAQELEVEELQQRNARN